MWPQRPGIEAPMRWASTFLQRRSDSPNGLIGAFDLLRATRKISFLRTPSLKWCSTPSAYLTSPIRMLRRLRRTGCSNRAGVLSMPHGAKPQSGRPRFFSRGPRDVRDGRMVDGHADVAVDVAIARRNPETLPDGRRENRAPDPETLPHGRCRGGRGSHPRQSTAPDAGQRGAVACGFLFLGRDCAPTVRSALRDSGTVDGRSDGS